jgi:thiol-disulfide isomerase/thioredoxin
MSILAIHTVEELESSLKDNIIVVILYSATWCRPCEHIYPQVEKLLPEFPDVVWIKEDVDLNLTPGIVSIPRFRVFYHGGLYQEILGGDINSLRECLLTIEP